MTEPVIRVRNIGKTYHITTSTEQTVFRSLVRYFKPWETRRLEALKNVSFDVYRGEVLGLIGPNGAGKSTLLMIMAGILRQDMGEIESTANVTSPFLSLGSALMAELSVEDNIRLCGALMGLSRQEVIDRMDAIVKFGELELYRHTRVAELSSGYQARVAFSTALHTELDTILVDETLSVGDMRFKSKCEGAFRRLISEGKTIVITSHNMNEVRSMCQRCAYLNNGELRAIGPTEAVIEQFTKEF